MENTLFSRDIFTALLLLFQECSDNGLGTYNNVVTVTKRDFDVYFETQELTSPEQGVETVSIPWILL